MLVNLVFFLGFAIVHVAECSKYASSPVFQLRLKELHSEKEQTEAKKEKITDISSKQRIIDYEILEKKVENNLPEDEFRVLCRIVEAEAGCEDLCGKIMIANVIINRVKHPAFPNDIKAVVFQQSNGTYQFSPIKDGRYQKVQVSDSTIDAVNRALSGEDYSEGALYFAARKAASPDKMRWFDTHLTRLLTHGGHDYFV